MPVEKTVVLIKPHAVAAGWSQKIIARYEERFEIVNQRTFLMTADMAARFYAEHEGKSFYDGLIKSMTEGPLMALLILGEDVIDQVRTFNGKTNPKEAAHGTIRHDFMGPGGPHNTVHGSDSRESAEREAGIVFS